ncbi:hypothetical protein [Sporosarcina sp. JAI121]|uniref:hypothetical protein n=1 Tax=Sporosarcina sp. JAI121 TaxID=2723064 RepID=UPI0015C91400|nr:hypothetical protein [Sporosarcina sp. JAI121]NYF25736.1 hypothetical protein [Sporosarcina sp. JAI121]
MERLSIESSEMELRNNKDFIAKLKMIGEGGPIYEQYEEYKKKWEDSRVFDDEENMPGEYQ